MFAVIAGFETPATATVFVPVVVLTETRASAWTSVIVSEP